MSKLITLEGRTMVELISHRPRRVAIVGGGISGIACLWGLRNSHCEAHLFEADPRLGGHADTHIFKGNRGSASVDTGFIAMNERTYRE